jgi:hypothetical protein
VACSGAIIAAVDLAVVLLRFAHCAMTTTELAEIDAILRGGHVRASSRVNLMIAVGLSILVDIVLRHDESPRKW